MSKRYMPSLDELDAGEVPVLGIRDRADLEDVLPPGETWGYGPYFHTLADDTEPEGEL